METGKNIRSTLTAPAGLGLAFRKIRSIHPPNFTLHHHSCTCFPYNYFISIFVDIFSLPPWMDAQLRWGIFPNSQFSLRWCTWFPGTSWTVVVEDLEPHCGRRTMPDCVSLSRCEVIRNPFKLKYIYIYINKSVNLGVLMSCPLGHTSPRTEFPSWTHSSLANIWEYEVFAGSKKRRVQ